MRSSKSLCKRKRNLKMKNQFSLFFLVLLVFPLVFSCGGGSSDSGSGSGSSEIGTIAFRSARIQGFNIYLMDADGNNQRKTSKNGP